MVMIYNDDEFSLHFTPTKRPLFPSTPLRRQTFAVTGGVSKGVPPMYASVATSFGARA